MVLLSCYSVQMNCAAMQMCPASLLAAEMTGDMPVIPVSMEMIEKDTAKFVKVLNPRFNSCVYPNAASLRSPLSCVEYDEPLATLGSASDSLY